MKTSNQETHVVRATHHYYGPKTKSELLVRGTLDECKQYVADHKQSRYVCDHNESGRPTLRIVKIESVKCSVRYVPTYTAQE